MDAQAQAEKARRFTNLHHTDEPLLLPNAWDFASAAAFVRAGFAAVGTTSLGVAASHGFPDAAGVTGPQTLALAESSARLPIPVTVDIEAGFGVDPAESAAELSAIGVAGVNIEDGRGDHLAALDEQCALISAFKGAAPNVFVNARVDTYWLHLATDDTMQRALAYVDAGADGVFVPGLRDEHLIGQLVTTLGHTPLNLLAELPFQRLRELGVRRVSTGSLPFRVAITAAASAVTAYATGAPTPAAMSYDEAQALIEDMNI